MKRTFLAVAVLSVLSACASQSPPPAAPAEPVENESTAAVAADACDVSEESYGACADLDGDGNDDRVVFDIDGTIHVGEAAVVGEVFHEPGSYWWKELGKDALSVVDIDASDSAKEALVTIYARGEEDPSRIYRLYRYQNDQLVQLGELSGTHGGGDLEFPGDGTVWRTQGDWEACGEGSGEIARRYRVAYRVEGGQLVEHNREDSGTVRCNELAG